MSQNLHSALLYGILHEFAPRLSPRGTVLYVADEEWRRQHIEAFAAPIVTAEMRRKAPDVVVSQQGRDRLFLVEASTGNGVITEARLRELGEMYARTNMNLVFVTAFSSRSAMAEDGQEIAWETEAWFADEPDHMVHFNGCQLSGPHP